MIACASDLARHDRMLDLTGGDAAALAEIRTALDLIAAQDAPDLASALVLACHRDQLTDRNTNIPAGSARRLGHPRSGHPRRSPRHLHHRPGRAGGRPGPGRGALAEAGQTPAGR